MSGKLHALSSVNFFTPKHIHVIFNKYYYTALS